MFLNTYPTLNNKFIMFFFLRYCPVVLKLNCYNNKNKFKYKMKLYTYKNELIVKYIDIKLTLILNLTLYIVKLLQLFV